MHQREISINKAVSSSTETGTVFINRDLFSNYYLGTLLDTEVRKYQGELGTRMPNNLRRRLVNLWERVTPGLGGNTGLPLTRQSFLNPLLTSLGFEPLEDLRIDDFSEFKGESLPHGYFLYRPPTPQSEIAFSSSTTGPLEQPSLLPLSLFSDLEPESEAEAAAEDDLTLSAAPHPTAVLFSLLRWSQDFDSPFPTRQRKSDTPSKLLERLLASGPAQWGILCNGQRMRLMKRMVVSGRQHYFEVDLESLFEGGEDYQFDIFWNLFRAQSYQPGPNGRCLLDLVDEGSRNHALGVSSTLKGSVFSAVETLMSALVSRARELVRLEPDSTDPVILQRREQAQKSLADLKALYEESLILLYRLLFIFYAESRNLLPSDRPVYRDSYSLEPLRDEIEQPNQHYLPDSFRLWETMQSLFRLIHYGCTTSLLIVPAYNGALFNPKRTPFLNALGVPDTAMKEIISHLSQTPPTRERGRERIDYSDLGVEQLGSVYEGLLEFEPHVSKIPMVEVRYKGERAVIPASESGRYQILRHFSLGDFYLGRGAGRKVSGSYYTPQPLVDFLVRRTLEPLVKNRSTAEILELKVVDPAMGSGAFLVGACLYLAQEYARAFQRENQSLSSIDSETETEPLPASDDPISPPANQLPTLSLMQDADEQAEPLDEERQQREELTEEETRPYRRLIAERCLYGVDLNEMAVELAKVSLWLITLAGDRPLTFLDANLRCGNSLIGAPLIPYYGSKGAEYTVERIHPEALRLLARAHGKKLEDIKGSKIDLNAAEGLWQKDELKAVMPLMQYRQWIAEVPSDTVQQVHEKEHFLDNLLKNSGRETFKKFCDLWVATWFWRQPPAKDAKKKPVPAVQNDLFALLDHAVEKPTSSEESEENIEASHKESIPQTHYSPFLNGTIYAELVSQFRGKRQKVSDLNITPYEKEIADIIKEVKPFHWELEFPEIFFDEQGKRRERSGFDAILANPPWDLVLPNSREFFSAYDPAFRELERVVANKRQKALLADQDTNDIWNNYVNNISSQIDYFDDSEVYPHQYAEVDGKLAKAHGNTYKLFLERAYNLLKQDGACGMITPSGLYSDQGCTGLRQVFLSHTQIDYLLSFENRKGIFPIDSRFKFALFGFQKKQTIGTFDAAFMLHDLEVLSGSSQQTLQIPSHLINRFSPNTFSVMEFRSQKDIDIINIMYSKYPLIGEDIEDEWNISCKRELNMTDDRWLFNELGIGWPLYEGKMMHQYTHRFKEAHYYIDIVLGKEELVRKEIQNLEAKLDEIALKKFILLQAATRQTRVAALLKEYNRGELNANDVRIDSDVPRLSIRDIAASTNERTMIVSILPAHIFEGNTLKHFRQWRFNIYKALEPVENFRDCYELVLPYNVTAFLCGIFNSFVVDYVLRFKVTSHVSAFYIDQLPIPRLTPEDSHCRAIAHRVAQLVCIGPEFDALRQELLGSIDAPVLPFEQKEARQQLQNEIDALVAHLYGLTQSDLEHILFAPYTFPLVRREIKSGVMREFARVETLLHDI